jgi:uncharacterized protein
MTTPATISERSGITIVTQTRVSPDNAEEFGRVQNAMAEAAEGFSGFVEQTVIPPNLPAQSDWVTLQWFSTKDEAGAWLRSTTRHSFADRTIPLATGQPNTYLVNERAGIAQSMATAVIATRVKDGCEAEYRKWEHRMAAAGSSAPGFQGYRFEPPIAKVQDKWIAVLWFDTDDDLQTWLSSPERAALLSDASAIVDTVSAHSVRTGFDQWFDTPPDTQPPAPWKMTMLVLVVLYPCVFLIDTFLVPPLTDRGVPFWLSLFGANALTVSVLGVAVPVVSRRFTWWLTPAGEARPTWQGVVAVVALYLLCMTATATYSLLR